MDGEVLTEEVGGGGAVGGVEARDAGGGKAVALGVPDVIRVGRGWADWLD